MRFRFLILTLCLVACTRSVEGSPIPPVTVVAAPTESAPGAQPTETPAPEATLVPAPTAAPPASRLPEGEPAVDPLPAPAGDWSIWRRGTDAGQVFRADAAGQVAEIRLPGGEDTRPSPEFSVSPDGQIIVYTLLDPGSGVVARSLAAFEPATGRLQTFPLDPATYNLVDFGTLSAAFSPAGAQVALALEGVPLGGSEPEYRVFLWDLQANTATIALSPGSAINPNLLPPAHTPLPAQWMPEGVLLAGRRYQSNTYSKTMLWEPETGRVAAAAETSVGFALRGLRLVGSAEVVWPDYDPAYPALALDCWGGASPNNVLHLHDMGGRRSQVIFAAGAGEQISRVRWLDGGERLAMLMIGCDRQATRLLVLDRQGAVHETVPVSGTLALFASGSDLILLSEDLNLNVTTLTAYAGAQNWAAREIAQIPGRLGAPGYTFGFVTNMTARAGLEPFPEVDAQASHAGLEIGRRATVASSSGVLNIRTEPNPDAPALGLLSAGDEVTIRDGPVTAPGGLVYWQVEADNGLIGWSVEAVEGERTLIPKP